MMAKIRGTSAVGLISGKYGSVIIANTRSGMVLRQRPSYKRPTSPGQQQAAQRLKQSATHWKSFTREQAEAWNAYSKGIERTNSLSGEHFTTSGFTAYTALAVKVLQVNPSADIPAYPPAGIFVGDSFLISATPDTEGITFTANGPNSAGVTTELLLQKLPNVRRAIGKAFKSVGFHVFEPGEMSLTIPIEPGIYVPAYQFVEAATGRVVGNCILDLIEVE